MSAAWVIPILFAIAPGTGNGDPWQTAGMLIVMAVTLVVALWPACDDPVPVDDPSVKAHSAPTAIV